MVCQAIEQHSTVNMVKEKGRRLTRGSQNTQPSELRFRAKLGDEPEVELALV